MTPFAARLGLFGASRRGVGLAGGTGVCLMCLLLSLLVSTTRGSTASTTANSHRTLTGIWSGGQHNGAVGFEIQTNPPRYKDWSQPFVYYSSTCSFDSLRQALLNSGVSRAREVLGSLGMTPESVEEACGGVWETAANQDFMPFRWVFGENDDQCVEEFFSGHESANEGRQGTARDKRTDKNMGYSQHVLSQENLAQRITKIASISTQQGIDFPDHLSHFDQCDLNTVLCCWSQDRKDDSSGTCEAPHDDNCVDADPHDNTDICHVDMANSASAADGGFAIFDKNVEGETQCHGFVWSDNEAKDPLSKLFRGNTLFNIATYSRGYLQGSVRNIAGAPMCACLEQMPVVSRADCTQVTAYGGVHYEYSYHPGTGEVAAGGTLSIRPVVDGELSFTPCTGTSLYNAGNLYHHFQYRVKQGHLARQETAGRSRDELVAQFRRHVVQQCGDATRDFLSRHNIRPLPSAAASPIPNFVTTLVSNTNRVLYNQDGDGSLLGAAPLHDYFRWDDQRWIIKSEEPSCRRYKGSLCVSIENFETGRRLYADRSKNGALGLGAFVPPDNDDNDKDIWWWRLTLAPTSTNKRRFTIVHVQSSRYLIANGNKEWDEGVTASTRVYQTGYHWTLETMPSEVLGRLQQ